LTPTKAAAPAEPTPIPPAEIAFEREPVNAIVVDENARLTHPLIKDAGKELRTPPADRDGIVHTPRGCVDVRVSKPSISRALRILQALFVALDDRGYSVTVKDGKTFISVLGEPFRVFLKERPRQVIRELTPEEHRQRRQGVAVNPYLLMPSGELAFYVGDPYTTKSLADGKKRRLEESLNLFVENLVHRAFTEKARHAELNQPSAFAQAHLYQPYVPRRAFVGRRPSTVSTFASIDSLFMRDGLAGIRSAHRPIRTGDGVEVGLDGALPPLCAATPRNSAGHVDSTPTRHAFNGHPIAAGRGRGCSRARHP
jgi:hypothetical protein